MKNDSLGLQEDHLQVISSLPNIFRLSPNYEFLRKYIALNPSSSIILLLIQETFSISSCYYSSIYLSSKEIKNTFIPLQSLQLGYVVNQYRCFHLFLHPLYTK